MKQLVQGSVPTPAAGSDFSFTPDANEPFRLLTLRAVLTTDATVASRYTRFRFTSQSGDVLFDTETGVSQPAGGTVSYNLIGGGGSGVYVNQSGFSVAVIGLPDFWWPPNTKVSTVTSSIDAGDTWTAITWLARIGEEYEHVRLLKEIADSLGD